MYTGNQEFLGFSLSFNVILCAGHFIPYATVDKWAGRTKIELVLTFLAGLFTRVGQRTRTTPPCAAPLLLLLFLLSLCHY